MLMLLLVPMLLLMLLLMPMLMLLLVLVLALIPGKAPQIPSPRRNPLEAQLMKATCSSASTSTPARDEEPRQVRLHVKKSLDKYACT
jgi:hypothetical protein